MKVLGPKEIRLADQHTIQSQGISSWRLMERAATSFTHALVYSHEDFNEALIICGAGNNGGDGLAIARILFNRGYHISVLIPTSEAQGSKDFVSNLEKLSALCPKSIKYISSGHDLKSIDLSDKTVVIDALFGIGLSRPLTGLYKEIVAWINDQVAHIVSVDIPSGLPSDSQLIGEAVNANSTFTFQCPKPCFFWPESSKYLGKWEVIDIGLDLLYLSTLSRDIFLTPGVAASIYQKRSKFGHKGTFGHSQIIAGSKGKIGAALLCTKAVLRSGAGLATAHIPKCGLNILQTGIPEAMVSEDTGSNHICNRDWQTKFSSFAVGPGIGLHDDTMNALLGLFIQHHHTPIVIDADALNLLAKHESLRDKLPKRSILTPHPGELKRLTGSYNSTFEELSLAKTFAAKYEVYLIVKRAFTCIVTPEGDVYYNSTGNPGMGTAGSGDTLTGVIAGLLSQGYSSLNASLLGVFVHGLAGDLAAERLGMEAILASDIIEHLGLAFKQLSHHLES